MATTALAVKLTSKTVVHLKNIQIHTDNSYQTEFFFIQDNVYNYYRTVFYHLLHQWMKIWKSGHKLRHGHKLVRLHYSAKKNWKVRNARDTAMQMKRTRERENERGFPKVYLTVITELALAFSFIAYSSFTAIRQIARTKMDLAPKERRMNNSTWTLALSLASNLFGPFLFFLSLSLSLSLCLSRLHWLCTLCVCCPRVTPRAAWACIPSARESTQVRVGPRREWNSLPTLNCRTAKSGGGGALYIP